jgi:signal peptidase II
MKEPNGWRWLPLTAALIVLDQLTKQLIVNRFQYGEMKELLPVLDLTLAYNRGAAWSFLAEAGGWQRWFFAVLAIAVSVFIFIWLGRLKARAQWMLSCSLSLILAGAVGNVIDRIRLGHVIDFIHVHWGNSSFPAFNVADSAITVGAILLLLDALLESRRAKAQSGGARPEGETSGVKADNKTPAP